VLAGFWLQSVAFKQLAKSIFGMPTSLLERVFMFEVIKVISSDNLQMCITAHARNMIADTRATAGGSGAKEMTSYCGMVSARQTKHELSQMYNVSVDAVSFVCLTIITSWL
jgi:hypothetical protein